MVGLRSHNLSMQAYFVHTTIPRVVSSSTSPMASKGKLPNISKRLPPRAKFPEQKIGVLNVLFDLNQFGSKTLSHITEYAEFGPGEEFQKKITSNIQIMPKKRKN